MDQFLCEIVPLTLTHPSSGPIELTTELTDMCDGTYELTYSVPVEGQFELSVKLFGDHIKGSPFKVGTCVPLLEEKLLSPCTIILMMAMMTHHGRDE